MKTAFHKFAAMAADAMGSSWAFLVALAAVILWAALGPHYHYSDTWELVINTGTTIVTFLMVFLIQHTQNRDTRALHLKLDELLRAVKGARTGLVNLEALSDEDLAQLQREFERLQQRNPVRAKGRRRQPD
jgi:low affinity Fe/Cu permease